MASTNFTEHYNLPQFEPKDIPTWLGDFNGAMEKIDTAIYQASQSGQTVSVVQETGASTTAVMSQKAVTDEFNDTLETVSAMIPKVLSTTGTSTTNVMSQKAVTDALPTIVQTTGTSTTNVMSQKAVTDNLNSLINNVKVTATWVPSEDQYITYSTTPAANLCNFTIDSTKSNHYVLVTFTIMGDTGATSSRQFNIQQKVGTTYTTLVTHQDDVAPANIQTTYTYLLKLYGNVTNLYVGTNNQTSGYKLNLLGTGTTAPKVLLIEF